MVVIKHVYFFVTFLNRNKKITGEDISVNDLTTITILNKPNESEATKLIKSNIVKVVNKIDDKTNIIGTVFLLKKLAPSYDIDVCDVENGISVKRYTEELLIFISVNLVIHYLVLNVLKMKEKTLCKKLSLDNNLIFYRIIVFFVLLFLYW